MVSAVWKRKYNFATFLMVPFLPSSVNWNVSLKSFCKPWAKAIPGILHPPERSLQDGAEAVEKAARLRPLALNQLRGLHQR